MSDEQKRKTKIQKIQEASDCAKAALAIKMIEITAFNRKIPPMSKRRKFLRLLNNNELFIPKDGIDIQDADLAKWKSVLTDEAFNMLREAVTKDNASAKSGHDVVRGCLIDEILKNQVITTLLAKQSS